VLPGAEFLNQRLGGWRIRMDAEYGQYALLALQAYYTRVEEPEPAPTPTPQPAAKPQDIFIMYYAGYGAASDNKEFYLVPHDVIQLYGNDGALAQKGLSAAELKAYFTKINARKQLFILNACQSSGALEAVSMRRKKRLRSWRVPRVHIGSRQPAVSNLHLNSPNPVMACLPTSCWKDLKGRPTGIMTAKSR
jgi:hypothetical protein